MLNALELPLRPRRRFSLSLRTALDIFWDALSNFMDNGQTNQAAAISLYAILSFIPFVILTFIMAGHIFGTYPEIKANLIATITYVSPAAASTITTQIGALEEKQRVLGGLGLITLIWFSSMVFGAIETALNITFRIQKPRMYLFSKALAISMIPLAWMVGLTSVVISSITTILSQVHVPFLASLAFLRGGLFSIFIPFVITVLLSTLVYKIIPPSLSLGGSASSPPLSSPFSWSQRSTFFLGMSPIMPNTTSSTALWKHSSYSSSGSSTSR